MSGDLPQWRIEPHVVGQDGPGQDGAEQDGAGQDVVRQDGADAGLSGLFATERGPMLRMATLIIGSRSRAEEIVQEAFVTVGERWDTIENPGGYLRTCVVNGCRSDLRRGASESRALMLLAGAPAIERPTPTHEIAAALDRLSDRQRMVMVLRYFVDIPDTEIASLLGVRPATVRSLARRAFAVLRKELS